MFTIRLMRNGPQQEIARYLRTGQCDELSSAWPGDGFLERAAYAHAALRQALVAEVHGRTGHIVEPDAYRDLDVRALTLAKLTPMVRGLFPRCEQDAVLEILEHSVVFLLPSNIATVLARTAWPGTAWALANLYLGSCGAKPLGDDAPAIVGMSENTTCYVSIEYLRSQDPFADYLVHEAAHIFHNCKRGTIGLRETRDREWRLPIAFAKREIFAYACEAYSCILRHAAGAADCTQLLSELERGPAPADERVDADEYIDILRDAVAARNGWRRILDRCSPPRRTRSTHLE